MANPQHLELLKSGVQNWNKWREDLKEISFDTPDTFHESFLSAERLIEIQLSWADLSKANLNAKKLSGANLSWANLKEADLGLADLSNADLRGAHLNDANLSEANLSGANLSSVLLKNANLRGTNLSFANLSEADLSNTDLTETNLRGANLSAARMVNTNLINSTFSATQFYKVDLSTALDLEKCKHFRNSYIDYHSLQLSKNLPTSFLRGCGLSEKYIIAYQELMKEDRYHNCFISYSTYDEVFANKLFNDLQENGIRVWYAPKDIKGGEKIHDQIKKGIEENEKLLIILSKYSIISPWVKTEIGEAFKKGKELGTQVLFPISLLPFEKLKKWENFDADFGRDLAKEIREYYLPNFANWENPVEYQKNFENLVESLRIEK